MQLAYHPVRHETGIYAVESESDGIHAYGILRAVGPLKPEWKLDPFSLRQYIESQDSEQAKQLAEWLESEFTG